jgi:hypothetical protein
MIKRKGSIPNFRKNRLLHSLHLCSDKTKNHIPAGNCFTFECMEKTFKLSKPLLSDIMGQH